LRELRDTLVGPTVLHAVNHCDFYRDLYHGVDVAAIARQDDLCRLPFVDKAQMRAAGRHVLCAHLEPAYVQNTSGTTGEFLLIHRSHEEQAFVQEFFSALIGRDTSPTPRPLTLSLYVPAHGTPTGVPSDALVLLQTVASTSTAENVLKLLRRTFAFRGVSDRVRILSGALSQVVLVTTYLQNHGGTVNLLPLQVVRVTGDYLSQRCRRWLENTWQAPVVDRYSLAEIFGGATSLSPAGRFTFDPHVVPEVVDIETGKPLDEGVGELVLTSLYPFVQLQPFIRYRTGDAFAVERPDEGVIIYQFLGRRDQCLWDPGSPGSLLIGGVDLYEALDEQPLVRRTQQDVHIDLPDHGTTGKPIARGEARVEAGVAAITVFAECVVDPYPFVERMADVAASIRGRLLERCPRLRARIDERAATLDVRLLPPGSVERQHADSFENHSAIWTEVSEREIGDAILPGVGSRGRDA
jgi:phenylacetate-coenzyme A ligase PaaK-like adenylate-forming protein